MHLSRFVRLGLCVLGATVTLAMRTPTASADPPQYCDPLLTPLETHPYAYRIRGDRCEGVYARKVSNTTLNLASFTRRFEDYDLRSDKELVIEWQGPVETNVRLRAQGILRKLYYRMDTVRPSGPRSYHWPLDIIAAMNIPKQSIGVLGWTIVSFENIQRQVYLPLNITKQNGRPRTGSYDLLIVPGRELQEVFVSLAAIEDYGSPGPFIMDSVPLQYGYYPSERSVGISISEPQRPGFYYLEIGASLSGGETASTGLWFYHAGP